MASSSPRHAFTCMFGITRSSIDKHISFGSKTKDSNFPLVTLSGVIYTKSQRTDLRPSNRILKCFETITVADAEPVIQRWNGISICLIVLYGDRWHARKTAMLDDDSMHSSDNIVLFLYV